MEWLDSRTSTIVYNKRTNKVYAPELKWECLTHEDLSPEYYAEVNLFKDLKVSFYTYEESSFMKDRVKLQIQVNEVTSYFEFGTLQESFDYAKIFLSLLIKKNLGFLWRNLNVRG